MGGMAIEIEPEVETRPDDPVPADVQRLAVLLDDYFRLPGTEFRIGLDGLIGMIPGIGDTLTAGLGAYIIGRAHKLGVSKPVLARMVLNLVIDWLVGLVPLLGDLLDFGFKGHRRNVQLLREYLERHPRAKDVPVTAHRDPHPAD